MTAPNYPHQALRPITVGGVTAFAPGDLIPGEHIDTLGLVQGQDYQDNPVYDASLTTAGAPDDTHELDAMTIPDSA